MLVKPNFKSVLVCFLATIITNILIKEFFPEINYFVRTFISVVFWLVVSIIFNFKKLSSANAILKFHSKKHKNFGFAVLISLIIINIIFR